MKLEILLPSADSLNQAGVRIRYLRTRQGLESAGWAVSIRPIGDLKGPGDLTADVYLFSKCYEPTALLVAQGARTVGARVGIDLFDDYFSQAADSRFARLRTWLRGMTALADFALASTSRMAEIATAAGAPRVHVLNDPGPPVSAEGLAEAVSRKRDEALRTGQLRVAWFGIGDNPYFSVGLRDLAAFADRLVPLRRSGFDAAVQILTNRRALTREALARLAAMPLPFTIAEWTEAGEAALLERATLCFLPVNAQPFSTAKSLNRVVTALSAGVQVLTAGHDLYGPFADFLYRDAEALAADLRVGCARVRAETAPALATRLAEVADAGAESVRLAAFLDTLGRAEGRMPDEANSILLHGLGVSIEAHKMARKWNALSVGSPLSSDKLNYHVLLHAVPGEGRLRPLLSDMAVSWLRPRVGAGLKPFGKVGAGQYQEIDIAASEPAPRYPGGDDLGAVAAYEDTMRACIALLGRLFPGIPCHVAEATRLPIPVITAGTAVRETAAP